MRFTFYGVGALLGVALLLVGWQVLGTSYTYRGSLIDPPARAADFSLLDQNEMQFKLSDRKGKLVLVFFGYTNCPDVCPITLSKFKNIKEGLGAQAELVDFVFITVDPERDTPERLAHHVEIFDPDFYGLTGAQSELNQVYKAYGVYAARQESSSALGYLVDHTARTYVIDQEGNWRMTFPYELDWESMLSDVKQLIREG